MASEKKVIYHSKFPGHWKETHIAGTGPEQCDNCNYHGSLGGEFIGYCANCADYQYHGTRGKGFHRNGKEDTFLAESAFNTYLSGLKVEGDKLVPSVSPP